MRRLLIVAATLAALALVAVLLIWQFLDTGSVRAAVEARLSATLGQPVSIGRLGVSLLPRVALSGGDVRVGEAQAQAPAVAVERIRILPRVGRLLRREIAIELVELDGFVVSVLRDAKGRWHVPSAVPAPSAGGSGATVEGVRVTNGRVRVFDAAANGEVAESASIEAVEAEVTSDAGGLRLSPISGRIGSAAIAGEARTDARAVRLEFNAEKIADGDLPVFLRLLGSERPEFLRLGEAASASVAVNVNRHTARLTGKGTLRAPAVVLEPLRVQRFEAPFTIDGPRLQFTPTAFAMYGGTHRGTVTVEVAESPPSWATDSRANGLDVGDFLGALTGTDQRIDGTAAVNAALRGRVGEALDRTVRGRMALNITNGVVRQFPLLATINRTLKLTAGEGSDTQFERLSATLNIATGQAATDDLLLEARHIRVHAAGRIGADRSLDLRGTAVVSAERVASAVASIREFARLRNSRGELEVPLTITGSLDAPSFGLDLGAAVKKGVADELRRRLRRFIRPPGE
jgi:AsmA protein